MEVNAEPTAEPTTGQGPEPTTDPTPQGDGTDWKAEARKWERRAKENAEKAKAYDETASKSRTLEERIAAIEAERDGLAGEKARSELVAKVAREFGISADLVSMLSGTDEQTLAAQARELAAIAKPRSSVVVPTDGDAPAAVGKPDAMRGFVRSLMGSE